MITRLRCAYVLRPRGHRDERGMTIIELVIAVFVFALVASGVTVAMGTGLNLTRNNKNRSIAANLASAEIDTVRGIAYSNFQSLAPGLVTGSRNVDGIDYRIDRESEWVSQGATTGACDTPGGTIPAYLRVTVEVSWPNMAGAKPVRSQTILTPPVGAYDPNSGHISVKVLDAAGMPAAGHVVTVSGPGGTKTQTTADGCAFFAYLDPGTYTVGLGSTGYVDRQGDSTPEQTAGVTVGQTASVQFDYDAAATLQLTLGQDPSNYPAGADNFPITIANPGLLPLPERVVAGSGITRTISNLFPYPSGYQVWIGTCADNDPEGIDGAGSPFHSGGIRQAVETSPGQTTTATIVMETVEISSVDANGLPILGANVHAIHRSDPGCPGGNLDLGSTNTPPNKLSVSLPYGNWSFTSEGGGETKNLSPGPPDPETVTVVGE